MFVSGFSLGLVLGVFFILIMSFRGLMSPDGQPILDIKRVIKPKIRKPVIQTDEKAYEREIQEQGETRG